MGAAVRAYDRGATILRVHDVREHVEALAAAKAVRRVIVELSGLEVFGYHGVEEAEQRLGQLFLFDVQLEVGDRGATDRLERRGRLHAGRERDPRAVGRASASTCSRRSPPRSPTCSCERFAPESLRLRVRKPQVEPAGMTVEYSRRHHRASVTVAYVGLGSNLGDREALIRQRRRADRSDPALDDHRDRAVGLRATSRGS